MSIEVPTLCIGVTKASDIALPDGQRLILCFRVLSAESKGIPRTPELQISGAAPLSGGKVMFQQDNLVYLPVPFPDSDIIAFTLRDPLDRKKVFARQRYGANAILSHANHNLHGSIDLRPAPEYAATLGKPRLDLDIQLYQANPEAPPPAVPPEAVVCDVLRRCACSGNNELTLEEYGRVFNIKELLEPFVQAARQAYVDKMRAGGVNGLQQDANFASLTQTASGKKRTPEEDTSGSDDPSSEPIPREVVAVPWEQAPLRASPNAGLVFGCNQDLAPIGKEIKQEVTFRNKKTVPIWCAVATKKPSVRRYVCTPSQGKFVVQPREAVTITFTLQLFCTADVNLRIPVRMWEKGSSSCFSCNLQGSVYGEPSNLLDPDEIPTQDKIGAGAFGTVFRSAYRGIPAAVKIIKYEGEGPDSETMEAFNREVENVERLRHPAIVHYIGNVNMAPILAIVTELCPYGSLQSTIGKYPQLSVLFRLKALLDIANAMNFLHNNHFVHRDLKTENALVCSLEPGIHPTSVAPIVKLADFGTTRGLGALSENKKMFITQDVGTPIFMAPEILLHSSCYTASVDVFSFAILIAHVMSGYVPYLEPTRKFKSRSEFDRGVINGTLRPDFPANASQSVRDVMAACWNGSPDKRPQFQQIVPALQRCIDEVVGTA